ncbi:titin-like [Alosa sapidissima]|uniref:titin-like n=1 Tax=Alosa sapidissima TaxID=34773 RepID=UPI001C0A0B19|nr:titin-like [Alosa sapidissima]XP_041940427.1 titin-like [Alosa sapidissima]XP_041940428.1 titin-like [Alosa sapidissima]
MLEEELELGFSPSQINWQSSTLSSLHCASPKAEKMAEVKHEDKKEHPTIAKFLRRRRSLSPTYIELMRPVSEFIRPPRACSTVEVEGEAIKRRSPTPDRTRPRSPSPVSTEGSSRSSSRFERSSRFDIMSRYESRKVALNSEIKYQVVTQAPFSLDHAPRITVRMRSHRVPCGQDTKFMLNVQAKPEAEIKWFHNGKEIQESSKYQITNLSGVLSLKVCQCIAEDSGTYRVVATNSKGETSDYTTLDVSGGEFSTYSSRRKDEEAPATFIPDVTTTDYYHISSVRPSSSSRTYLEVKETSTNFVE